MSAVPSLSEDCPARADKAGAYLPVHDTHPNVGKKRGKNGLIDPFLLVDAFQSQNTGKIPPLTVLPFCDLVL